MLKFTKAFLNSRPTSFLFPSSCRYFSNKEVIDMRKHDIQQRLPETFVNCLVLHPVGYPNKGAMGELYLAEEAIGLAKALDWNVIKGPYWKEKVGSASNQQEGPGASENEDFTVVEDDADMYDEWKNELLRNSLAKSSLVKIRQPSSAYLFGKGKVEELSIFIRSNDVNAVFVNSELTALQIRNLEKEWNKAANLHDDYAKGEDGEPTKVIDVGEKSEEEELEEEIERKIKVFDRFTIILQIFAKRAKTRIAKLQIEMAFLNFLKTKLMREGTTFSGMYNIFSGDLMSAEEIKLEVVSSKQRGALGKMSGAGETQLEIERRVISDKEAKIRRELLTETASRKQLRQRRKASHNAMPNIALIGYTNAGKSALMNKLTKAGVESQNKLFQTLSTTSKKLKLGTGQLGLLLDTIGFITNLPHDLVESFKCTLEEVQDADIVLHVRDISHPNTEDQKETVLQVLRELGFDQSFYTKKMVEVWNKIDLMEERIDYKKLAKSPIPIVPISAVYGTNCDKLVEVITNKVNETMGKRLYQLVASPEFYSERINWLFKNGSITEVQDYKYIDKPTNDYPYGKIHFGVFLDDVTYRRYMTTFENKGGEKEREKIPDDWIKSSKSFFERRAEEKEKERQKLKKLEDTSKSGKEQLPPKRED